MIAMGKYLIFLSVKKTKSQDYRRGGGRQRWEGGRGAGEEGKVKGEGVEGRKQKVDKKYKYIMRKKC